ncbi:MAG: SURF1 family protein [Pseudomonadota bacterium]
MLQRIVSARLIWPTVLAVAGLSVLVSLGAWQWRRLAWKEDLIAKLQSSTTAEPITLSALLELDRADGRDRVRFRRVVAAGTFDHENEFHVWAGKPSGPAWLVITPLRLATPVTHSGQAPIKTVLVMRGVVPQGRKQRALRARDDVRGRVEFVGRIRLGSAPNWAANPPDLERNEWYERDLGAMTRVLAERQAAKAPSGTIAAATFPMFIEAEQKVGGADAPAPDLAAISLSNRHFEYALTWWGLAMTLIGVYAAFAWSRLRGSEYGSRG